MDLLSCVNLSISPVLTDLSLRNSSVDIQYLLTGRDAAWILTSSVIIFSMQTGFGLLESGCVNPKNEVNIMMKNALDVVFGGITYWAVGFGMSFGASPGTNAFIGVGCFFVDASNPKMGYIYAVFIFQLSFATTSTTIVSGAMAERTRLRAYIVFSMLNTVIYSIPAHWIWASGGFLEQLGCLDAAGCGPVHVIGGATGLVATLMLGPRQHMKDGIKKESLPSPMKSLIGTFMLWWGWIRFNSGSVFVISSDAQWELAVRGAVNTIVGSMSGAIIGIILSILLSLKFDRPRFDVGTLINALLGSLVSVTGICTMCKPWESLVIGAFAALLTAATEGTTAALKIDDPVGVIPVHLAAGIWGLLAIGLFIDERYSIIPGTGGVIKTGNWYLLGVQTLAAVSFVVWTVITSYILLKIIDLSIGLRLSGPEEMKGSDVIEHGVQDDLYSRSMGELLAHDDMFHDRASHVSSIEHNAEAAETNGMTSDMIFFREFMHNCKMNELQLVLRRRGRNSISFDISSTDNDNAIDQTPNTSLEELSSPSLTNQYQSSIFQGNHLQNHHQQNGYDIHTISQTIIEETRL